METQLENSSCICVQTLIINITGYLTGNKNSTNTIIKVNNHNLLENGDLYFLNSIKAWNCTLKNEKLCNEKCTTILQHFLHTHDNKVDNRNDADIAEEVFQLLVSASKSWPIKIERCSLQKEKVCLFLSQVSLVADAIKIVTKEGQNFGRHPLTDKVFSLKTQHDKESELTTTRLHLIQAVTEKVLDVHGYKVKDEDSTFGIIFTSKSQGDVEENYVKYICGVVKNSQSNTKETLLTWLEYVENKVKELGELNEHKYLEIEDYSLRKKTFLRNIAQAIVKFELLAVKPSRPVLIGQNCSADRSTSNTKGASFVLYNTARIATIIGKYNEKKLKGEYPNLPNIENIDFSLLKQEEEWDLVYNFILGYQRMLKECIKYEPEFQINPQVICLFLSRLCQKFSIYYRRIRILTEAYEHLIPVMLARLYMISALQIILQNALALLDIDPVSRM